MGRRHPAEALFREGALRVVAISRAGKKPKAVILLSNDSTLKVSAVAAAIVGIQQGTVLTDALRRDLVEAEDVADAVNKAVKMLAASPKTVGELRQRLLARAFEPRTVARALKHLESHNLLDDAAIARSIADQPATSPALARHVMETRHVPTNVIERTMKSLGGERENALEAARHLIEHVPSSLAPEARRKRLIAVMARRGFEEESTIEAVDRVIAHREATGER